MSRWARASTSTRASVLFALAVTAAGPATAGSGPPPPTGLEEGLAARPDVYLVVDPEAREVRVKTRGLELEAIALSGVALLGYRQPGGARVGPVVLPAAWRVREDVQAPFRRAVSPAELAPYPGPAFPALPAAPTGGDSPSPPWRPSTFRVGLEPEGWVLHVGPALPASGALARIGQAFADGWRRIRGEPVDRPRLLALALDEEAARRLHQLLRPGTAVLVLAAAPSDGR